MSHSKSSNLQIGIYTLVQTKSCTHLTQISRLFLFYFLIKPIKVRNTRLFQQYNLNTILVQFQYNSSTILVRFYYNSSTILEPSLNQLRMDIRYAYNLSEDCLKPCDQAKKYNKFKNLKLSIGFFFVQKKIDRRKGIRLASRFVQENIHKMQNAKPFSLV